VTILKNEVLTLEEKLLKRVSKLPSDLASAYWDDLNATAEERLTFFERLAKK
jgi:hypothetical protein